VGYPKRGSGNRRNLDFAVSEIVQNTRKHGPKSRKLERR